MTSPVIIQFDTDDYYMTVVDLILSVWGIKTAKKIYSMDGADKLVSQIKSGQLKPDIAIVDSYMNRSEVDGENIARFLKTLLPNIKIVGFSTEETKKWADYEAIKGNKKDKTSIIEALTTLLNQEYQFSNLTEENAPLNPGEFKGAND